jgi:hypothetical protein
VGPCPAHAAEAISPEGGVAPSLGVSPAGFGLTIPKTSRAAFQTAIRFGSAPNRPVFGVCGECVVSVDVALSQ